MQTVTTDSFFAERKNREIKQHKVHMALTTVVKPSRVYEFLRNFQNIPLFAKEVKVIEPIRNTQTRWKILQDSGISAEWDLEVVRDVPDKMIVWASDQARGEVRLLPAPGNRGTVIEVIVDYELAGGAFAELANKIFGESPHDIVRKSMHKLKAYLETGEVPTTDGQPSGREKTSTTVHPN